MTLTLSFKSGTFKSAEEVLNFMMRHLHFMPVAISSPWSFSGGYHDFNREEALEKFRNNNDTTFTIADDFYLYADEKNKIMYREDSYKYVQYFIFDFQKLDNTWLKSLIEEAHSIGFFMGYLTDEIKSIWQSQEFLNHYTQTGRSFSHLNFKMHWHPILSPIVKNEIIDIFYNPGHSIMTYNTWLMAAPEMWFSKDSWEYFNKEKIKSFKEAIEINEWQDDLLYVKLFDATADDYESKEILSLQSQFRELSEMNKIEKELEEICNKKNESKPKDTLIKTINYTPTIETKRDVSEN